MSGASNFNYVLTTSFLIQNNVKIFLKIAEKFLKIIINKKNHGNVNIIENKYIV